MSEIKDDKLQLRVTKTFKKEVLVQTAKHGFQYPIEYIEYLVKKDMKEGK